MLENNRLWLEQSNKQLLEQYKENPVKPPSNDSPEVRHLVITHEAKNPNLPSYYISPDFYQRQREIVEKLPQVESSKTPRFLIVGGTDGGHLLKEVNKTTKATHLIVIESDMDSFHQSLQVIDWPSIFEEYDQRGGTIFFHIGPVTIDIKTRIAKHLLEIGIFNASTIHYVIEESDKGKMAVHHVITCLQDGINSLGFYDDERVGMAHTIFKINEGARFLSKFSRPWIEKPAVVCGNGPSLKKLLPQIRKHRNKIFLISCGTSINVFFKEGIKPDFYIEQERPKVTSNWTRLTTTPEFRDGITCIGLNVVHPQTHGMFKDIAYVLKGNDLGAIFASQYISGPLVNYVNPLAGNCGASLACAIGFKSIYLAGIDCAYAEDGSHHTGNSSEYSVKADDVIMQGNFREEVITTSLWKNSAFTMELLVRNYPDVNFYNLCDGALIRGAKPTLKLNPKPTKNVSKAEIMEPFIEATNKVDLDDIRRRFTMYFFGLRQIIDSIPEVKSQGEAFFFIDKIHNYILDMKTKNPIFWYLIKGSFTTQLVFMSACAENNIEAFNQSSAVLKEFAVLVHEQIKSNLFDFDSWESNGGLPEDVNRSSQ